MFDTHHVQNLVSTGVLNLMKDTFSVIALVSLMFYQNWKLALFAILMMPLAGGLARSLGKRIGKATSRASFSAGTLISMLSEIFKASKMIRIYQKEDDENTKAQKAIDDLVEKNIKIGSIMIRATPIMELLTGFMIAGFIYYSGFMIVSGEMGINNFFSFLTAMMLAYQPIRSLATINMLFYQGAAGAERVFQVLDAEPNIKENQSLPSLKIEKGNIDFKNVSFSYPKTNTAAIKNINISIEWTSKVNNLLALTGYDPEYGARPIKREIRNVIEDQISQLIITNEVKDGKTLFVDVVDNKINMIVK